MCPSHSIFVTRTSTTGCSGSGTSQAGGWALMLSDQTDDTNDHNMKVSGSILAHE
jgi:hypothetical protein